MSVIGQLTAEVHVETHGGLEDSRIGLVRRTLALWLLDLASRLLRTRLDIKLRNVR